MIEHSTRCLACQAGVPEGKVFCPSCGAAVPAHVPWPEWHGKPEHEDWGQEGWLPVREVEDEVPANFETLALDPALLDAPRARSGGRTLALGLVMSALGWAFVGLLYEVGNPAGWWDPVWYAAGALATVFALGVLVSVIQRTRTHGWQAALEWLVS